MKNTYKIALAPVALFLLAAAFGVPSCIRSLAGPSPSMTTNDAGPSDGLGTSPSLTAPTPEGLGTSPQ